jgi:hypothetical protein
MTKKEKKQLWIVGIVAVLIFLYSRGRRPGKTIDVGVDFLVEAYYDMVKSATNLNYEGEPLHLYLARNTYNFTAVADEYYNMYRENLYEAIITRLTDAEIIAFNNAHYKATGVKIFNI